MKYLAEKDLKRIKEEEEEEERRYAAEHQQEAEKPPEPAAIGALAVRLELGHQTNPDDDELNEDVASSKTS